MGAMKMKRERSKEKVRTDITSYFHICTGGAETLTKKGEHFKMSLAVVLENVHAEQFCNGSRGDGLDVNLLGHFHLQFL